VLRSLCNAGGFADDRFGEAGPRRAPLKKVFPDHWMFLLREAAMTGRGRGAAPKCPPAAGPQRRRPAAGRRL